MSVDDFDDEIFKTYKNEFIKATKKVLKQNISKNPDTLSKTENEIVELHDKIAAYISPFFDLFDNKHKAHYRSELIYIRDKTLKCFGALGSKLKVSKTLTELLSDSNEYTDASDENSDLELESSSDLTLANDTIINVESSEMTNNSDNNTDKNTTSNTDKMALTLLDYLRFAAQAINKNYAGDPLSLDAFVNSVNLVKSVDTAKQYGEQLKTFVLAKLEGKALECVPQDGTLDEILKALKKNITPENSKVITGRMLSLRFNKNSASTFAAEAEKLAEALQRSLIVEGISQTKAKEMAVERTVEMCRQSAKSDLVRSVLAAASFNDPKDVVAKLITEQNTHDTERQILYFNRQNNNNFRKNNNGYNGKKNFNNYNNYRSDSNSRDFHQNKRGSFQKRGRGRGGRGNYNVRVTENFQGPSESDGHNNQSNQSFTLEKANSK